MRLAKLSVAPVVQVQGRGSVGVAREHLVAGADAPKYSLKFFWD